MSDVDVATDPVDQVVEPVEQEPEKDLAAEVDKWKAMSRKNEARAKENEAAARRLAEIEEANKTELEKALARAEAAEKVVREREEADERARLATDVAERFGIADPGVLSGATLEDLEDHAKRIKSMIPEIPKSPGDFASGNVGDPITSAEQITSVSELDNMTPDQINEARAAGRLDKIMGKL